MGNRTSRSVYWYRMRDIMAGPSHALPCGPAIMNNRRSERASSSVTTGGQDTQVAASAGTSVNDEAVFLSSLSVIDDVTAHVCRRHRLSPVETEDFRSDVRLHFIQRNYEPLRRFEGRSSLQTYLNVVIQRLFLDYRNRLWGKWRPSAEATRLGPTAILIEQLVARDGWTFEQVVEMFRVNHCVILEGALAEFCVTVLQRPPGRRFVGEDEAEHVESATPSPDANVLRAEQDFLAKRVRTALDRAREALTPEERLILKMRFDQCVPVADIALALQLDRKRLYRTIERLLATLCQMLEAAGISRDEVNALFAEGSLNAAQEGAPDESAGAAAIAAPAKRVRTPWLQKR
jgi:RNA polymerase sigma factor (sigma-70 family)